MAIQIQFTDVIGWLHSPGVYEVAELRDQRKEYPPRLMHLDAGDPVHGGGL